MSKDNKETVEVTEVASTVIFIAGDKAKHLEKGEQIELSLEDAKHLESKGYGKIQK